MRLIDADKLPKYNGYALSASEIAVAVENAPTIDAKPVRHGHWIKMQFNNANFQCTCSVCGGGAIHPQFQWYKENIYPYCPNCGAKMDEDELFEKNEKVGDKEKKWA